MTYNAFGGTLNLARLNSAPTFELWRGNLTMPNLCDIIVYWLRQMFAILCESIK